MKMPESWTAGLKWLLVAIVISSILHYVDNLLYFEEYPEPPWINRSMVDAFWFFMTPLAWIGYQLMRRGRHHSGTLVLLAFTACNLFTLGHYQFAPMHSIGARIHFFILLEAALASLLAIFLCAYYAKRALEK
ncbi:hypothetical protein [Microbulbifer aggregans]|uniref:hypothetical protein n=1 Tax=Microbulbifer aggregans TaxID=1769779 RepID=UPI001CFE0582|nr:hypothetical protein [Microbulbifer aggregans]